MIEAVRLPPGEDIQEWLAVNTVDFYNAISVLYSTLAEFCTEASCEVMSAGSKVGLQDYYQQMLLLAPVRVDPSTQQAVPEFTAAFREFEENQGVIKYSGHRRPVLPHSVAVGQAVVMNRRTLSVLLLWLYSGISLCVHSLSENSRKSLPPCCALLLCAV